MRLSGPINSHMPLVTALADSRAPPGRRNCRAAPLRYSVLVTPEELAEAIRTVLTTAATDGSLALPVEDVPLPRVERPRNRDHGDWSTNIAMQLARKAGTNPRALAELLVPRLAELDGVDSVEIAGPGFLNFRVSAASAGELARTIVEAGTDYGRNDSLAGQHVNLEYVSANPTGPVHLGGARWAAVGDSLARILVACGATVTREYYFNDHGTQIDHFAESLLAAARGEATPENGYGGAYIAEIAQKVIDDELAAGRPDPATSHWPIAACSSWTRPPSSPAASWTACASPWRPVRSPSIGSAGGRPSPPPSSSFWRPTPVPAARAAGAGWSAPVHPCGAGATSPGCRGRSWIASTSRSMLRPSPPGTWQPVLRASRVGMSPHVCCRPALEQPIGSRRRPGGLRGRCRGPGCARPPPVWSRPC